MLSGKGLLRNFFRVGVCRVSIHGVVMHECMYCTNGFITGYTPLRIVVSGNLSSVCVEYKLPQ